MGGHDHDLRDGSHPGPGVQADPPPRRLTATVMIALEVPDHPDVTLTPDAVGVLLEEELEMWMHSAGPAVITRLHVQRVTEAT